MAGEGAGCRHRSGHGVGLARELRLGVQALHVAHSISRHADVALYAAKRAGRNRVAALRGGAELDAEIVPLAEPQ